MTTESKLDIRPPFDSPPQQPPGTEREMHPKADHGEDSYEGTGRLQGMRAVVTGADSGIGRAVAIAFAREGADVAISYLSEDADAAVTEEEVARAGRRTIRVRGDLAEPEPCRELISKARETLGGIDILVNNAAYQRTYDSFDEIPEEEFVEAFRVNVFAMFRLCQLALPGMQEGSSIINTASIQSFDPSPTLIPYAATKAAIVSFTSTLAGLVVNRGIRVNAVAPGPVWTPLIPSTMPEEAVAKFGKSCAFGRPAQPSELAPIYVFLASNQASFVTGEVYGATGGRMPI